VDHNFTSPKDKLIDITFAKDKAGTPCGFTVSFFRNALEQVRNNLERVNKSFVELVANPEAKTGEVVDWIFPIFIPSKGRHGQPTGIPSDPLKDQTKPDSSKMALLPLVNVNGPNDKNNMMKLAGPTLVFLVVEKQEVK
jgi:hypothetical protein